VIVTDPVGRYDPDRPRQWGVHFLAGAGADPVVVRQYATPGLGEDLTEDPPSRELTWEEWAISHGEYGLDTDGQPL
jgi:hypothetical protein